MIESKPQHSLKFPAIPGVWLLPGEATSFAFTVPAENTRTNSQLFNRQLYWVLVGKSRGLLSQYDVSSSQDNAP